MFLYRSLFAFQYKMISECVWVGRTRTSALLFDVVKGVW